MTSTTFALFLFTKTKLVFFALTTKRIRKYFFSI